MTSRDPEFTPAPAHVSKIASLKLVRAIVAARGADPTAVAAQLEELFAITDAGFPVMKDVVIYLAQQVADLLIQSGGGPTLALEQVNNALSEIMLSVPDSDDPT